ncbi:Os08g0482025 [Oryza sativa Japonica Group]|uniref:Os08g0482025 protein n=1 Tax=Oryza sativa subsp. japonica TaxID=39947 RepID=A0A0P0XH53_ORYSJ|nr:hypothetical protein EE612_044956 [Oryza sativa]BAT05934.1 Os08g0482025 [Oryza sativa Japonica Group]
MHEACDPNQCPYLHVHEGKLLHPCQSSQSWSLPGQVDSHNHTWLIQIYLQLGTPNALALRYPGHHQHHPLTIAMCSIPSIRDR